MNEKKMDDNFFRGGGGSGNYHLDAFLFGGWGLGVLVLHIFSIPAISFYLR